jgi:hypothetical protein
MIRKRAEFRFLEMCREQHRGKSVSRKHQSASAPICVIGKMRE